MLVLGASLGPSLVSAQADVAAARRAFREGLAAARAERWPEARDRFRRAYELAPRPRILVNLGSAYRQTGELLQSRATFQEFLRSDEEDDDLRETVEAELAEVVALIPQLTLRVQNLQPGDRVLIDGEPAELDRAIEMDPGWREVSVERDGRSVAQVRVNVEPEGREEVQLRAPDPLSPGEVARTGGEVGDGEPDPIGGDDDDGAPVGAIVGGVVGGVVVVAGVILAILLAGGDPDPFRGNYPGGMSVPVP